MSHVSLATNCTIIVPVFNEEHEINSTIDRILSITATIPSVQFELLCVNDGSSDGTAAILDQRKDLRVIHHQVNRGYGAALRTGIEASEGEWLFITDADGTYPLEELPRFWASLASGVDMVVGAREGVGINEAPFRRLARWILRKMVQLLTGSMVPDLNSGMRIFKRKLYQEFRHLLPMGFSFTTTITVASLYSGYIIKYLPIKYSLRTGRSNIKPVQDFFSFTILILRLASYFEPLRFFLPLSLIFFILAILRSVRDVIVANYIGSLSVMFFVVALQLFITGLLADVIVKRSNS